MQSVNRRPMPQRTGMAVQIGVILCLCLASAWAGAQEMQHSHGNMDAMMADPASASSPPPAFIASTAKPFAALMDDAMAVMDDGMKRAPMNGQSEHDFITMMIPHHQGAVDMAKAVLLYSKDPEIINLALGIITEQQNEIRVMRAWLAHHAYGADK